MAEFQLKALITGVDKLSPQLEGIRKKIAGFRKGIDKTGFGKLGFSDLITGGAFAAPFVAGTKAAIDFESQMADVRKVVDFDTPEQFKKMGDDILDMSKRLPMAAEGIAQIVAAAGQSGIAKNELAQFAEDATKMGIAFDITADQSGDMMAKWRTAFKMTQKEVVDLADKINFLGNTGAAKANQISEVVTRIGPLGEVAGVSSAQIAALGATIVGTGTDTAVASTGLKNFMLTLTAGASATKKQQLALKALRLDSRKVAEGMQKDSEATIKDVLNRISQVDETKRAALLTQLFGRESVGAIAPLVNSLDLLRKNLKRVGDETQYTGSMQKEYEARAKTTANNIQLLKNQVKAAAISLGSIFLPAVNDTIAVMSPFMGFIADLIRDNPELVKTIAIVGASFVGMKLAVYGVTKAFAILNTVMGMSPVGLMLRGIALAAGLIIANWDTVGPFFKDIAGSLGSSIGSMLNMIRELFGLSPVDWESTWKNMGLVIDDLRSKTTKLIEEFVKLRESWIAIKPAGFEDLGKSATAATPDKWGGTMGRPQIQPPTISQSSTIVNPQANKINGEININLNNAPAGTTVEQVKSNQPMKVNTKQKVGERNMGVN